jgi:hypothetical protein
MKMWKIVFSGCLAVILAGCASLGPEFEGVYRLDCHSVAPFDASDPKNQASLAKCEATFNTKSELLIKLNRDKSGNWWGDIHGNSMRVKEVKTLNGYTCLLQGTSGICKIPRDTDIHLFTGNAPAVRSRTGVVLFMTSEDGERVGMIVDLIKVQGQ